MRLRSITRPLSPSGRSSTVSPSRKGCQMVMKKLAVILLMMVQTARKPTPMSAATLASSAQSPLTLKPQSCKIKKRGTDPQQRAPDAGEEQDRVGGHVEPRPQSEQQAPQQPIAGDHGDRYREEDRDRPDHRPDGKAVMPHPGSQVVSHRRLAAQSLRARTSAPVAPSPTADAKRLIEPWRTSPAANTPGMLVSM